MNTHEPPPERAAIAPEGKVPAGTLAGFFRVPALWLICLPTLALILAVNVGLARFGQRAPSVPAVRPLVPVATAIDSRPDDPTGLVNVATTVAPGSSGSSTPIGASATVATPAAAVAGLATSIARIPAGVAISTPTTTPAAVIRQRIVDTETTVRSGEITTTIAYPNGNRTTVHTRFDLGDGRTPARLQSEATYRSAFGDQVIGRITVGGQTWQQQGTGPWGATEDGESVAEQVRGLLPNLGTATGVRSGQQGGEATFGWFDTGRGADMTLEADTVTGRPRQLQAVVAETGVDVTWRYDGWGTAVAILAPDAG